AQDPTATAPATQAVPAAQDPTATAPATQAVPAQGTPTMAAPSPTPLPTATAPRPTATLVVPSRDALVAHYPQVAQSVVSLVEHPGVWDADQIQDQVVLQMLDAALVQLTGIEDAALAWRVLFDAGERVGIKVNTISRYTTTPQIAYAVAQRLQDAGLSAEQIVIFDRTDWELQAQGFTINADGAGVRCRGAKGWEAPTDIAGQTQRLHDVLLSCHALINIPALKEHGTSGFTSAMKNHYGTVDRPGALHGNACDPYIATLNALPEIRAKTRLIVGDWIRTCPYDWNQMTRESKIAMSFDPVAHDTVGRQVLLARREADGRPAGYIAGKSHYIDTAIEMALGADQAHTELRKILLG
ncbi:MAG: DUF362 domain-containing protein, partial [Anaerolineae bacterium]|nr:DUF362 domain-containing protein [Anaerolineae bacterium]